MEMNTCTLDKTLLCRVTWRHRVRNHLISKVPFPIDARSIVTKSLSPAVFEIMNQNILGHDNDLSR